MKKDHLDSGDLLCGIDEAGRGPLAGPVCAAAVILPKEFPFWILDDSKKMSPSAREEARIIICFGALAWGIGWASAAEIDEINIHRASLLAMKRAFDCMAVSMDDSISGPVDSRQGVHTPPLQGGVVDSMLGESNRKEPGKISAIADGLFVPDISVPCIALVQADSKIPSVMAASILAKTARDRLMEYYGIFYPEYNYEKHKGYPTKAHREAIRLFGPSPIQRMSFKCR